MADPNFKETVVLMIEHNDEGAFGLVVNRRSPLTLGDIIPRHNNARGHATPVYVGGPVQQEYLFVVHSELPEGAEPSPAAQSPVSGVMFEPMFSQVERFFDEEVWSAVPADDRPRIHLFLGYSGWAAGQLEREMAQGAWITQPANERIVFHPNPDEGWRAALREKGGIYKIFADSNQQPGLN